MRHFPLSASPRTPRAAGEHQPADPRRASMSRAGLAGVAVVGFLVPVAGVLALAPTASATTQVTEYVATSGTDTGSCTTSTAPCRTIRYAVDGAENDTGVATTIVIGAGTYDESGISISVSADNTSIVLQGAGQSSTTVDGEGDRQSIFSVDVQSATSSVTISGLTITGADTGNQGGGVDVSGGSGSVTVSDDTISGNESAQGGGIFIGAPTTVVDDTITGNSADYSGGGYGGAIYLSSTTGSVVDDTITDNYAYASGGGFGGGAILNFGTMTVADDTITGNYLDPTGGPVSFGGGGLLNLGTLRLSDSIVAANAGGDCSTPAEGSDEPVDGGHNVTDDSSCGLSGDNGDVIVANDTAIWPSGSPPLLAANGSSGPETESITDGSAAFEIVPAANCLQSTDERGAPRPGFPSLDCDAGAFELQPPQVTLHVDTDGLATSGCSGTGTGACATIAEGIAAAETLSDSAVTIVVDPGTYNEADESDSIDVPAGSSLDILGAGASDTTIDDQGGGSDFAVESGPVTITGLTITGGSAPGGGGVLNDGAVVELTDNILSYDTGTSSGLIGGGVYGDGGTTTLVGDALYDDTSPGGGGGVGVWQNGTATLTDDTFTDDSAGVAAAGHDGSVSGGGVFLDDAQSTIDGDTFSNDSTADAGGGVYNIGDGTATLTDDTFTDDTAPTDVGGGIYNGATAIVSDSTFADNSAPGGGGIWNYGSLAVIDSTFADNSALGPDGGGGVASANPPTDSDLTATLVDDTFSGNTADDGPGGAIESYDGNSTIAGSIFSDNTVADGVLESCGSGGIIDDGYNVEDDSSCGSAAGTTITGSSNIDLGPLAANGSSGPETEAITPASSAFEHVGAQQCESVTTDERGLPRPGLGGGNCDAGAFELQPMGQSIEFTSAAPTDAVVGGTSYLVSATGGGSGIAVVFSLDPGSAGCTLSGATVTFTAAGPCVIDANQAGNTAFSPAVQQQQSFQVAPGTQAITFTSTAPADAVVNGDAYTVTATGGESDQPVTFSVDGGSSGCALDGSVVSFSAGGECLIDANQAGGDGYLAAPQVQQSFAVATAAQAIDFTSTAPLHAVVGGPTYSVSASGGGSGEPVTFELANQSTGCALSGTVVSFTGTGVCEIDANQAGDLAYAAAIQQTQSFAVSSGSQSIYFTSTPPRTAVVGGPGYTVSATGGGSGEPVTYALDPASAGCALNGTAVTLVAAGTCIIDANQVGNSGYGAAAEAQQAFAVARASTGITLGDIHGPSEYYGDEQAIEFTWSVTPEFSGQPTGTVAVTVSHTVLCSAAAGSDSCSVSPRQATLLGAGGYSVVASYSGTPTGYLPSTSSQVSIVVAKEPTSTKLTPSGKSAVHGHEQSLRFAVAVSPKYSGVALGTVTIEVSKAAGAKGLRPATAVSVCKVVLSARSSGKGTCSPGAKAIAVGSYSVIAVYSASGSLVGSSSAPPAALKIT